MRIIITGHRIQKLKDYDLGFIDYAINDTIKLLMEKGASLAYSGMADGVDLWFCQACKTNNLPYIACVPFEEQDEYMSFEDKTLRNSLLATAKEIMKVRNSWMVEHCDYGIVVWDGCKGGTHNVLEQLVGNGTPFYWINPMSKKVWHCA